MKKVFITLALVMAVTTASAQNKLVRKAQALYAECVVEGKVNHAKVAETQAVLAPALTSPETKNIAQAWDLQGNLHQMLFAEELNKAAANMPLDTASFIKNLFACLSAYDKCYEVDEKQEFTKKNKENLMKFRTFCIYVGQFASSNGQNLQAYEGFDHWLNYGKLHPMVAAEPAIQKDSTLDENMVAYYACLSAYGAKRYDLLNKHIAQALNYEKEKANVIQLLLVTHLEQGDTLSWVADSRKFALADMSNDAIAQNLLAYYFEKSDYAAATAFADELIAANPNNKIANYSKGVVLFQQGKNLEALPYFEKTTEIDPEYADAYFNAGVCYSNAGYAINDALNGKKLSKAEWDKEVEKVKEMYRKAEPFFLKVKELKPDEPNRWAGRLQTVYYIIGDKEKEAEMKALLDY